MTFNKTNIETGSANTSNNSTVGSTGTGLSDMFKMSDDQKACGQDTNLGGIRKIKKTYSLASQSEIDNIFDYDHIEDLDGMIEE